MNEISNASADYREEYPRRLIEYFSASPSVERVETLYHPNGEIKQERTVREPSRLPTFEGFAASLEVATDALRDWSRAYPEFGAACRRALDLQRDALIQNGLLGLYNAAFARFAASALCGMGVSPTAEGAELPQIVDDFGELP